MLKNIIYKYILNRRAINAVFIDIGVKKSLYIDNNNCIEYNKIKYIFNPDKIINGVLYFDSRISEPMALSRNDNNFEYYIDSNEFTTVLENKVLKDLLISNESTYILIILALVAAGLIASIAIYLQNNEMMAHLEYFRSIITQNNYVPIRP